MTDTRCRRVSDYTWYRKELALDDLKKYQEVNKAFDDAITLGDTKHALAAKSRLQEKIGNTNTGTL